MNENKNKETGFPDLKNAEMLINTDCMNYFELEDYAIRRLYINYEITPAVINSIVYHILRYNRMDKNIRKEKREPIIIYINTPGGDVSSGLSLIDAILTSETPVYTVNQGICFSMGFLIFLAGKKRFSFPHSEFLMHEGVTTIWDSATKAKDRLDFEMNQVEKHIKDFVISHSKIDDKLYDAKRRIEWYMLPEEAKEHGIVTDIVGVDISLSDIL